MASGGGYVLDASFAASSGCGGRLPAIGVYWDIENCQVPRQKSAASVVQRVRDYFFDGHRQVEFIVVCDVYKENPRIIKELHESQVNVIHVSAVAKNAADDKLRQSLRHFGDTYSPPATVVLITGDINFASDVSELRYAKKIRIVLLHNANVSKALKQCADEACLFSALTEDLPNHIIQAIQSFQINVCNLPHNYESKLIKKRLNFLSDNCGGRVTNVCTNTGTAVIRFATWSSANRAQRRLNGEDVFGRKIGAYGVEHSSSALNKTTRSLPYDGNTSRQSANNWPRQGTSRNSDWRGTSSRTSEPPPPSPLSFDCDSVELIITNLDASMRNLRSVLEAQLKQHVGARHKMHMCYTESKPSAIVRVANQQDAEYLISRMHHQKLGYRRLSISYLRHRDNDYEELKQRVVYLLQESPTKSIPLYMLLNMLDAKYLMRVSLCEVNRLRDVCQIVEENGERLVTLTPEVLAAAPASFQQPQLMHYCCVHCPNGMTDIAICQPDMYEPLCVRMSLKEFGRKVHKMLVSHMGTLPLLSFTNCYKAEFDAEPPVDSVNGVALEHLITCVGNVKLRYESAKNKAKFVVWDMSLKSDEPEHLSKNASPLASSICLLRREFIDLLRSEPRCQIPLGKFVPAYHHHFGRQLRVADYGYTKLDDLLHSAHLASMVQILGEGANRVLTLTHYAQMRRFTSDLMRMLKSKVPKQITLREFEEVYMRIFHKEFCPLTYGVCALEDLLDDIPENSFVLTKEEGEITISIPMRVRTPEEIVRTKQFAEEVVKLLSHSPSNSMLFDKFVPHYHHHFGHQCKVSDYGFTKLIELFEAIPGTVKVEELPNGQRIISLTHEQSLNMLGERIVELMRKFHYFYLPLDQLGQAYLHEYKAALNPQLYGCSDLTELLGKLAEFVTISTNGNGQQMIIPVHKDCHSSFELRVWSLLITPPHNCDANKLLFNYYSRFKTSISIADLEQLSNIIMTRTSDGYVVFLIPEYVKAAKLYQLLLSNGGQMTVHSMDSWYEREYGQKLSQDVGYEKFFSDYSFLFMLSRSQKKTSVSLNPKLSELKLPLTNDNNNVSLAGSLWSAPAAMLNVPYEATSSVASVARSTPPKPDTPPAGMLMVWNQLSPSHQDMDFSISLPSPEPALNVPNANNLISPAKHLLPAHPMGTMISSFPPAPHPSELPTPSKLLHPGMFVDDSADSADSGVHNSQFASENEMDNSPEVKASEGPKFSRLNKFLF